MFSYRVMLVSTLVVAAVTAGCGGSSSDKSSGATPSGSGSTALTIYSSLPMQGASKGSTVPMVNGIKLALAQRQSKAGTFSIKYVPLDDSSAQAGTWTPELVSANARRAAEDKSAIAYLGEFNSGATALSLPLLNRAGVAQTGVNSAVGLTQDGPGSQPGEPAKYYPTGKRTFVRGTPSDGIQAQALATLMKAESCTKAAILNDREIYGAGLAAGVVSAAKAVGLNVVSNQGIDPKAPNYRSIAQGMKAKGTDCFLFTGVTANNAVQAFKDVATAIPAVKMFGDDGLPEPAFFDPKAGGLPASIASQVLLTVPTVPENAYPPAGQKFFKDYRAKYGEDPGTYAIYTYEATNLVLDAIERAGAKGNDRAAVIKQLFATRDRNSVLGRYSIAPSGDTTNRSEGVYAIKDGKLAYERTIQAKG